MSRFYNSAALLGGEYKVLQVPTSLVRSAIPRGYYLANSATGGGSDFYNDAAICGGFFDMSKQIGHRKGRNGKRVPITRKVFKSWLQQGDVFDEDEGGNIVIRIPDDLSEEEFSDVCEGIKQTLLHDVPESHEKKFLSTLDKHIFFLAYLSDYLKYEYEKYHYKYVTIKDKDPRNRKDRLKAYRLQQKMRKNLVNLNEFVKGRGVQSHVRRLLNLVRKLQYPKTGRYKHISRETAKALGRMDLYSPASNKAIYLNYLYRGISPFYKRKSVAKNV